MKPQVCMLYTDGTNCDQETAHAFRLAGGTAEFVHINQLRDGSRQLLSYAILVISGGFSYGDDVRSGQVLATELMTFLSDQLRTFVERGRLILGICNGFQVLVRTGLLPFNTLGQTSVSLTRNDSGKFECRWAQLTVEGDRCVFTRGLQNYWLQNVCMNGRGLRICLFTRNCGGKICLPVAHAEGKFTTDWDTMYHIVEGDLVALRYTTGDDIATVYPANPNGSLGGIAGVCDKTGRILGLMPHPERFVVSTQHPNWRRGDGGREPDGLVFFRNAVSAALEL